MEVNSNDTMKELLEEQAKFQKQAAELNHEVNILKNKLGDANQNINELKTDKTQLQS